MNRSFDIVLTDMDRVLQLSHLLSHSMRLQSAVAGKSSCGAQLQL